MRNLVGSLLTAGGVFIAIVLVGSLFQRPLTVEDFAFNMGIGVYLGLRFGSDFNSSLFWRHLGIAAIVYFALWAIFASDAHGPLIQMSLAERGFALGSLAGICMLMTLIVYEAVRRQPVKSFIDYQDNPWHGGNPTIAPPQEVASHWIDVEADAMRIADPSTSGQLKAEAWARKAWCFELDRLYKLLLESANHDLRTLVEESQTRWQQFGSIENALNDVIYSTKQGTMYLPMGAAARVEIIRARVQQIEEYLKLLEIEIPSSSKRSMPSEVPHPFYNGSSA